MSGGLHGRIHDEAGVTSVEYGILAAAVGVTMVMAGPVLAEAFFALLDAIMGGVLGD